MVDGDVSGSIAGRDIISNTLVQIDRDPYDKEIVDSLLARNAQLARNIEDLGREVAEAVSKLSRLNAAPIAILAAKSSLLDGDTSKARALYRQDAEDLLLEGPSARGDAADMFRREGNLALLEDVQAAIEAFSQAIDASPADFEAWRQLRYAYEELEGRHGDDAQLGNHERMIEAIGSGAKFVVSLEPNLVDIGCGIESGSGYLGNLMAGEDYISYYVPATGAWISEGPLQASENCEHHNNAPYAYDSPLHKMELDADNPRINLWGGIFSLDDDGLLFSGDVHVGNVVAIY